MGSSLLHTAKKIYKYLVVMVGEYIITTDRPLRTRYGQRATWWCGCGIRKWSNHSLTMISYESTWSRPPKTLKKAKLAFYFLPSEKNAIFRYCDVYTLHILMSQPILTITWKKNNWLINRSLQKRDSLSLYYHVFWTRQNQLSHITHIQAQCKERLVMSVAIIEFQSMY